MLENTLRETCRALLESGEVKVIIGYGQQNPDKPVVPVFITDPKDVNKLVWNSKCYYNLTTYLKRKEISSLGKPAVVVKGCDEKVLVMLEKESQISRNRIYVIGMACEGLGEPKCETCEVHQPRFADKIIGEAKNESHTIAARYKEVDAFMAKPASERWAYWTDEFSRCVKCYACRQVCPLCYCERCIVDKDRPQAISTSSSAKGNFAWHITRAFHLSARCIGCDECTRSCPAGINLRLLNQSLAKSAEESFDFRSGVDVEAEPVTGSYSTKDKENFIR